MRLLFLIATLAAIGCSQPGAQNFPSQSNEALLQELKALRSEVMSLKDFQEREYQERYAFDQCERSCEQTAPWPKWIDPDDVTPEEYRRHEQLREQAKQCADSCEKIRPPGVLGQC